jgi:hypothetical protein
VKWIGRSCAAPTSRLRRTRLSFRAARQPRAALSPGVARTEATLGVRTPAWSLRVRRQPRPPFAHRSVACSSTVTRAGRGLGRRARLGIRGRSTGGLHAHIWGGFPARGGADRAPSASPCGASEFLPSQPPSSALADLATTTNP